MSAALSDRPHKPPCIAYRARQVFGMEGKPKTGHATHLECRETGGEALELYINQLVSASLSSPRVGLLINQTASLYGQNFTTHANITFGELPSNTVWLHSACS